jgi:FAD/FMN-containing dehydrogenase
MSGFNSIEYNNEKGVAVVGTGMRWGDVYHYLDQYNVTVVGGRILQVGVGGLTLGSTCLLATYWRKRVAD